MVNNDDVQKVFLKKYYGYDDFRSNQLDIIRAIVKRRDVLAILPTGGGKSICFQIPALNFKGITLVISPLISLMKDQVDSLKRRGIKATYLNSSIDKNKLKLRVQQIKALEHKIIYVSPERLNTRSFSELVKDLNIDFIAIDEAHCISQWGHDFRPAYLEISAFTASLPVKPVIAAFTATATRKVRQDMIRQLRLQRPKKFIGTFNRENLHLKILREDEALKQKTIIETIKANSEQDGTFLIFCQSRKLVEELHSELVKNNLSSAYYHAGLSKDRRKQVQENFMNDKYKIVVCTNAFGMGIDKGDVRLVIHAGLPSNLENYYQEIGRAGRDGSESNCILIYSVNDIKQRQYQHRMKFSEEKVKNDPNGIFRNKSPKEIQNLKNWDYEKLRAMLGYLITDECRKAYILRYFGENLKQPCGKCDICNPHFNALIC